MICTRGDVSLTRSLSGIPENWPVVVWDNNVREDMKVFGYFAALDEVTTDYVYTQADDCVVPAQQLADGWTEDDQDRIVLNQADGDTPWISFGAIFRKDLPWRAFDRYLAGYPRDNDFLLWCEVIFAELTPWRNEFVGWENLPWYLLPHRMWRQPNHYIDQQRIRTRCEVLREAELHV